MDEAATDDTMETDTKQAMVLYFGRWTDEEEAYAEGLMQEFRAGNIPDLENGATLRNYIAKMLGCPPKRITKKYERTAYNGKLTYVENLNAMVEEESRRRQGHLQSLRDKFLASRKRRLLRKRQKKPRPSNAYNMKGVAETKRDAADDAPVNNDAVPQGSGPLPFNAVESMSNTVLSSFSSAGLTPNILHPSASTMGSLSHATQARNLLLDQGGNLMLHPRLREVIHLEALQQSTRPNSFLLGRRNLPLHQTLGVGPRPGSNPLLSSPVNHSLGGASGPTINNLLGHQYLLRDQIQRERERNALLQQALLNQYHTIRAEGAPLPAQGAMYDLARQLRAAQSRNPLDDKPLATFIPKK